MKIKSDTIIGPLEITDTGIEGKGVGRWEGKVIFVKGAVPGDRVMAKVKKSKSSMADAEMSELVQPSSHRTEAFCMHFGTCGGCKWQHLNYASQLFFKQKHVEENIRRIGGIDTDVLPIVPSALQRSYRNKLEYTFASRRWLTELSEEMPKQHIPGLGFHVPRRFDKVLDIDHCSLQDEPGNAIRNFVREFALKNEWEFYDPKQRRGWLRNLMIRNTLGGEWMVVLIVNEGNDDNREVLLNEIKNTFPFITSLQYIINTKSNDSFQDLDPILFHGRDYIEENMEGLRFRIGAKSFYQTNPHQAVRLYQVAREMAALQGHEMVYDLYTGTGTIAQFVSQRASGVVGIEYVERAIEDARANARLNGIHNVHFYAGDMKDVLNDELVARHGVPEVIITDPPRAGMQEGVVRKILDLHPQRIVYVSCNPSTQARDLALMNEYYRTVNVQPVDMFPHTDHVESVALLVKRDL
jgi:23S rRNA (uracil1939-C5)-methyltransferase